MKKLVLLLTITLLLTACKKSDDDIAPIDQLPEATQTGENTFGCLLNGEAFLPSGGTNPLDCVYEYYNGTYHFALQGNRRDDLGYLTTIGISTDSKEINEGETYLFKENQEGNAYGVYIYIINISYTSQTYSGELTITKLDEENQIVSGTFWLDILDHNGEVQEIREGRFDMEYAE